MIDININYHEIHDSLKWIKDWAPVIASSATLVLTGCIAFVARSVQKDASYRDIQKMFRDFYEIGLHDDKKLKNYC